MTWFERMLEATTPPPETDDIATLLAAWSAIVSVRQALLDEAGRPRAIMPEDTAITAEILACEQRWHTALASARHRVGAQRIHTRQAHRYQRALDAADL
ncbi:hypothetical protein BH11MYX1_BH11MYX1_39880 [soil metagenome]